MSFRDLCKEDELIRKSEEQRSAGRWVWCPNNWQCVPKFPSACMRSELRRVSISSIAQMWEAGCDATPEPPSGWQQGNLPHPIAGLTYDPSLPEHERYWTGTFDTPSDSEWWTPLPPPPEETK